ncbi:MAG TPA: hypothetical protein VID48_02130 [Solirubrobacteraceae bacterium]|jgi:hypothetical protein
MSWHSVSERSHAGSGLSHHPGLAIDLEKSAKTAIAPNLPVDRAGHREQHPLQPLLLAGELSDAAGFDDAASCPATFATDVFTAAK